MNNADFNLAPIETRPEIQLRIKKERKKKKGEKGEKEGEKRRR